MTEQLHFSELWPHWPALLAGLWVTIQLTVMATVGGLAIGIFGAAIRSGRPTWYSRTEIIRAGIQVTPRGQWEAGRVLGLTRLQTFIRVVLPPALQRIYPALVSQCIIVMLGSSVVSQVSYEELTFAANLIQSRTFLSFEVYLVTTGIYLALSITLRQLMMAAGRKWLGVQA